MGKVSMIAASGRDMSIGRGGDMPWHLKEDLQHFKRVTTGHAVIMGRRTWESLPKRPLPGRVNIVISRDSRYSAPGALTATSLDEALALCTDDPEPFIIGGGEIYRQAMPSAHRIYLTLIDTDTPDADTFFPAINPDVWHVAEEEGPYTSLSGLSYKFMVYESDNHK